MASIACTTLPEVADSFLHVFCFLSVFCMSFLRFNRKQALHYARPSQMCAWIRRVWYDSWKAARSSMSSVCLNIVLHVSFLLCLFLFFIFHFSNKNEVNTFGSFLLILLSKYFNECEMRTHGVRCTSAFIFEMTKEWNYSSFCSTRFNSSRFPFSLFLILKSEKF